MTAEIEPQLEKSQEQIAVDPERVAFETAQDSPTDPELQRPVYLSGGELTLGMIFLVVWFGLFSGGILISTAPYRKAIETPVAEVSLVSSWVVVCLFWTITNVGVLSIVSAFLGALGRRTRFTSRIDPMQTAINAALAASNGLATYYVSAVMRGFGVYTLMLAGLLVLATELLLEPSQASYLRLAPTISIISFYAGYDPSVFAGLLDRVNSFMQTSPAKKNSGT